MVISLTLNTSRLGPPIVKVVAAQFFEIRMLTELDA